MVFKKLLAPVQQLLLKNCQCVGCGRNLKNQKHQEYKKKILVYCQCGRIFIKENDKFRRALFNEVN